VLKNIICVSVSKYYMALAAYVWSEAVLVCLYMYTMISRTREIRQDLNRIKQWNLMLSHTFYTHIY